VAKDTLKNKDQTIAGYLKDYFVLVRGLLHTAAYACFAGNCAYAY
jgi:hypothetical protein